MSPSRAYACDGAPEPEACVSCGGCARLAAEVAALRAENERLRQRLELPPRAATAGASDAAAPQPPAPPAPSTPGVASAFSRKEMQRYSRQMLVKEFGADAQRHLRAARVLVVGAGGLGSPVALYLAAMGVGKLTIVDDDRVDSSNLHRQVLHDESQLHEEKARSAQRRLRAINPLVECEPVTERFTARNAHALVARHDVVVDASDNVGTRYLVNDACAAAQTPLVSGSAIGMEGQLTVFTYRHSTGCYRCLYPSPPRAQPMSCAENGVVGVVPGVIGCLQAMEAVKLITGVGEPLVGVQCLYDAYDGQFRRLKLPARKRSECPACGAAAGGPVVESDCAGVQDARAGLLAGISTMESGHSARLGPQLFYEGGGSCGDYEAEAAAAVSRLEESQRIAVENFAEVRRAGAASRYILLDVRPKQQFDMVHFREAAHVPLQSFASREPGAAALERLLGAAQVCKSPSAEGGAKMPTVYVICRRGIDSVAATEWLARSGVKHVRNVDGGYTAYAKRVDTAFPIY